MEDLIAELDTLLDLMREALEDPELPPRAAARVPEHVKTATPPKGSSGQQHHQQGGVES